MIGAARTMLARVALGALLETIGRLMAATSRVDPVLRSCITRDLVFEISTDEGVARHWQFDGAAHEVSSHAGGAPAPTSALRFADASVALRVLAGSSVASDAAVAAGQMRIDGSSTQALWFSGLVKRVLKLGRWGVPRQRLPGAYVAHDPHSRAASFITVEPPQHELDRPWRAAWQQRGKLAMVRVPAGEPPSEF